jgi:hypothetical protein
MLITTPVTVPYFTYWELNDHIHKMYGFNKNVFEHFFINLIPEDCQISTFHISDMIINKKYNNEQQLFLLKLIEKEFGKSIVIERSTC